MPGPIISVNDILISKDLLSKVMTIRNVGQVPLHWFIEDSEKIQSTVPWLHFSPFDGALAVKQVTIMKT